TSFAQPVLPPVPVVTCHQVAFSATVGGSVRTVSRWSLQSRWSRVFEAEAVSESCDQSPSGHVPAPSAGEPTTRTCAPPARTAKFADFGGKTVGAGGGSVAVAAGDAVPPAAVVELWTVGDGAAAFFESLPFVSTTTMAAMAPTVIS